MADDILLQRNANNYSCVFFSFFYARSILFSSRDSVYQLLFNIFIRFGCFIECRMSAIVSFRLVRVLLCFERGCILSSFYALLCRARVGIVRFCYSVVECLWRGCRQWIIAVNVCASGSRCCGRWVHQANANPVHGKQQLINFGFWFICQ